MGDQCVANVGKDGQERIERATCLCSVLQFMDHRLSEGKPRRFQLVHSGNAE